MTTFMLITDMQTALIRSKLVTAELVSSAVLATAGTPTTWLEHLVQAGLIDDVAVAHCVAHAAFVPTCGPARLASLSAEVLAQVPWDLAIEHRVMPLAIESDGDLRLAMIDPNDPTALVELEFFLGRRLLREVAPVTAMARALSTHYRAPAPSWHPAARPVTAPSVLRSRPVATIRVLQAA